jgi:hypothetical protein
VSELRFRLPDIPRLSGDIPDMVFRLIEYQDLSVVFGLRDALIESGREGTADGLMRDLAVSLARQVRNSQETDRIYRIEQWDNVAERLLTRFWWTLFDQQRSLSTLAAYPTKEEHSKQISDHLDEAVASGDVARMAELGILTETGIPVTAADVRVASGLPAPQSEGGN